MNTRTYLFPALALCALVALLVSACSSSPTPYQAGKTFGVDDIKAQSGPGTSPPYLIGYTVQQFCQMDGHLKVVGQAPAQNGFPALKGTPTNAPAAGTSAYSQWVNGCTAGIYSVDPHPYGPNTSDTPGGGNPNNLGTNPSGFVGAPNSYAPVVTPFHESWLYQATDFYANGGGTYLIPGGTHVQMNCWYLQSSGVKMFYVTLPDGTSGDVNAGDVLNQWMSSPYCHK